MPYYAVATLVLNETTATGTTDIPISDVVVGYQSLIGSDLDYTGTYFPYVIKGVSGECIGQIEYGYGTLDEGTLVRDANARSIIAGEDVGAPMDFVAGTKHIYVAPLDSELRYLFELKAGFDRRLLNQSVSARASTADGTPTILRGYTYINLVSQGHPEDTTDYSGSTFEFIAAFDAAYTFDMIVNAFKAATNDCAAWRVTCLVNVTAGVPALVGSPTPTSIAATAGASGWDLDLGVSSTALTLTATGEAASDIEWSVAGYAAS